MQTRFLSTASSLAPRLAPFVAPVLLGLALTGAAGGALAQAERLTEETPVARVSGRAITRKELLDKLYRYNGKAGLEQLIDRTILGLEGATYGLEVTDAEVAARAAETKKEAGNRFDEALKAEGITEETWRDRARYVILMEKVLDRKWPVKPHDLERLTVRYARLRSERAARELIREAQASRGANFSTLVLQRSEDKENAGLLQPEKFFKIDQPQFFKMASEANLRVGQLTATPIESGGSYLVLRLEGRYPAETLSAREREQATQRIRAYRAMNLLPTVRRRYKVEYKTPISELARTSPPEGAAELALVSNARGDKKTITRKEIEAHLLQYYGQLTLDQLIQRSIVAQAAEKERVSVTDAEITAFQNELVRGLGKSGFQSALDREGITEADWRERTRYVLLAEKVVNARQPVSPDQLERLTVRYIRVASKEQAEQVLQAMRGGARFEDVQRQASLDRLGDGFLRPRQFFRVDNPVIFDAFPKEVRAGQVLPRPVELGGQYLVLRLEARFGPETLTAQERASALRRINASRMDPLLESLRREARPEILVPIKTLIADARA